MPMTTKAALKRPFFVRAKIKIEIDGEVLEFRDRDVSLFGVMGLPWRGLSASSDFGRSVMVLVHIPLREPVIFRTKARITRETTRYSTHMGLKFELGPAQALKLRKTIEEFGFSPSSHNRQYPRIPALDWLGDFPVRAGVKVSTGKHQFEAIFDVADLSPAGALLETENPLASILVPGMRLQVSLEPRGKKEKKLAIPALICRIIDATNPHNRNSLRQIGVSFSGMSKTTHSVYLAWLRDILTDLKRGKPLV